MLKIEVNNKGELKLNGRIPIKYFSWKPMGFCYFCGKNNNMDPYVYTFTPTPSFFNHKQIFCDNCFQKLYVMADFINA